MNQNESQSPNDAAVNPFIQMLIDNPPKGYEGVKEELEAELMQDAKEAIDKMVRWFEKYGVEFVNHAMLILSPVADKLVEEKLAPFKEAMDSVDTTEPSASSSPMEEAHAAPAPVDVQDQDPNE